MNDFTFQTGKNNQHPLVNVSFPVNFKPFTLFGWDRHRAPENRTQGWDKVGLAIKIGEIGKCIKKTFLKHHGPRKNRFPLNDD